MEACMQSPGWNRVKYWGYVDHKEVYYYIKKSDIGIAMVYP